MKMIPRSYSLNRRKQNLFQVIRLHWFFVTHWKTKTFIFPRHRLDLLGRKLVSVLGEIEKTFSFCPQGVTAPTHPQSMVPQLLARRRGRSPPGSTARAAGGPTRGRVPYGRGTRESFDAIFERWERAMTPRRLEFLDSCRGKRLLEIGCGIGIDGRYFSSIGVKYPAVDMSRES
jgi:hypothetical protein